MTTSPRRSRSCPAARPRTSPPGSAGSAREARLVARRTDDAGGRLIAGELERARRRAGRAAGRAASARAPWSPWSRPTGRARSRATAARRGRSGPDDVDAAMVAGADVLHVAGYTLLRDPGAEAALLLAEAARRYGARVSVDLSTAHGIAELGREEMRSARGRARTRRRVRQRGRGGGVRGAARRALGRQARRARLHGRAGRRARRARGHRGRRASSTPRAPAMPSRRASCSRAIPSAPRSAGRPPRPAA